MTQTYRKDKRGENRWHYWARNNRWIPTPLDRYGFPKVAWLRKHGAEILRSEIKVERCRSLCGKFTYNQGYRIDHYARGYTPPHFACSGETRGSAEDLQICWPISQENGRPA